MSRILGIVSGVLLVILGIYCLFTPVITYGVVSWFIAFAMISDGISKIMLWNEFRKIGVKDIWALISGVLSVALGIALACSNVAQAAVDIFVAYMVACWILIGGIARVVRSFQMRKVQTKLDTLALGSNWDIVLITGILMVVLGILCLFNPIVVMVALGWQIGFAMIVGGIGLIAVTV